jgi:hypothetical protein
MEVTIALIIARTTRPVQFRSTTAEIETPTTTADRATAMGMCEK